MTRFLMIVSLALRTQAGMAQSQLFATQSAITQSQSRAEIVSIDPAPRQLCPHLISPNSTKLAF
jgi:hypothetical protein